MTNDYPIDCGIDEEAGPCEESYSSFAYFGTCITTVDDDEIWDATEMASIVWNSSTLSPEQMAGRLHGGRRDLPAGFAERFESGRGEFYCGVCEYERVAWIYDADEDIHYFFDAEA